jgi:hypothetical protein
MPKTSILPKRIRTGAKDANFSIQFTVTREDCKGSVVSDACKCASAVAIKRQLDKAVLEVWVKRTRTFIEYKDGRILRFANPVDLQKTIENYDVTAGLFPPGDYVLTPIPLSDRKGERAKRGAYFTSHQSKGIRKHRTRPAFALR